MTNPTLFDTPSIGCLTIRNRIALPAVHLGMAADGAPSEALTEFYRRRAKGGVGMITVGVCNTWPMGDIPLGNCLDLSVDRSLEPWSRLTQTVKAHGAAVGIQLSPLCGYNNPRWQPDPERIDDIVQSVGAAAKRAATAGFDFVELLFSGGSLFSHFLSPAHNTWEIPGYSNGETERLRAPLEAISAVKNALTGELPLIVRIHGHEFLEGGYTVSGAEKIAREIAKAGVSAINVTGAGHRTTLPQLTHQVPAAVFSFLARQIKQTVDLPVFTGTQIRYPADAQRALTAADADFVNVARAIVVDPDWPEKARTGKENQISPCMACCGCFDRAIQGKAMRCSLNPTVGRAGIGTKPVHSGKRALVVGGGPAGLEAAWQLHQTGHRVTIWEKTGRLGGKWRLAAGLHGREFLKQSLFRRLQKIEQAEIQIVTNRTATPETVSDFNAQILVLATGGSPRKTALPGLSTHTNVLTPNGAVTHPGLVGQHVAIIGGGGVGVETALHLSADGEPNLCTLGFLARHGEAAWLKEALELRPKRRITLLRRRGFIGKGLGRSVRWTLLKELERLKVVLIDRCRYDSVTSTGLHIFNERTNRDEFIKADTLIIAAGYDPTPHLLDEYKAAAPTVITIGDAENVANIGAAIAAAYKWVTKKA